MSCSCTCEALDSPAQPSGPELPYLQRSPAITLAIPSGYRKRAVVEELRAVVLRESAQVVVRDTLERAYQEPQPFVLIDGWGDLSLLDAVRYCTALSTMNVAVATDRRSDLGALLEAGADDAIRWPITPKELLARIRARLRNPRKPTPKPQIQLLPEERALVLNSVVVPLTPDQTRLLEALLRARGRWITSRELLESVFHSKQRDTARIRRQIHRLRTRLADEAWRLQGNRVLGYRFDVSARAAEAGRTHHATKPKK